MPRTRSGRVVKAPTRYEPEEIPLDDDDPGELEELGSDDDLVEGVYSDEEESDDDDEEDADEDGNLAGFVVGDDDISEDEEEDEDEEDEDEYEYEEDDGSDEDCSDEDDD